MLRAVKEYCVQTVVLVVSSVDDDVGLSFRPSKCGRWGYPLDVVENYNNEQSCNDKSRHSLTRRLSSCHFAFVLVLSTSDTSARPISKDMHDSGVAPVIGTRKRSSPCLVC